MLPALWCFNKILTNIRCTTTATGLRGFKFGLVCHFKIFCILHFLQLFAAFVRAFVAAFCSSAPPQTRNKILHKMTKVCYYVLLDTARILHGYCTDTARIQHTNCPSIPPGYCTDTARHLPSCMIFSREYCMLFSNGAKWLAPRGGWLEVDGWLLVVNGSVDLPRMFSPQVFPHRCCLSSWPCPGAYLALSCRCLGRLMEVHDAYGQLQPPVWLSMDS